MQILDEALNQRAFIKLGAESPQVGGFVLRARDLVRRSMELFIASHLIHLLRCSAWLWSTLAARLF